MVLMKRYFKFIIIFFILTIIITIIIWFQFFKSEVSGPISVEVVSEDGLLKLTMSLEKTVFPVNPREPVKITLTLTNIGDQEITLTFCYKSKFDVRVFDVNQGEDAYRWSYEHIQGPPTWCADPATWEGETLILEPPEMNTITLKPGESISEIIIWDQHSAGEATQTFPPTKPVPCPKGRYRIYGYAGFSNWFGYERIDNPLRYFEYTKPDGTLAKTVLETPGVDIRLV